MSFTDEYYKLMQPKKKKKDEEKSFSDEYHDLVGTSSKKPSASDAKQYLKSFNGALDAVSSKDEIAPTFGGSRGGGFSNSRGGGFGGDGTFYTTGSGDGGNFGFDNRKWYEKGAFEDGYDFGDITRTILGTSKDQGESLEDTIAKNDALISKNTKILSSTKMDGTDHSVLEEMQAIAGMKSGKEKRERKAAVLSKMEELGISASDYGLYSGDGNFNIDTFLDWTDNAAMSGLAAFNKGVTATADLLLGNPLKALGWENNPVSSMADYYSDTYDTYRYNADLYRTKLWGDSGGASFGQSAIEGVTGALPTAILALMTGGASLGATTSSLTTTAAYETGGLLTKAGLTTSAMMKNPQFWLSFSRELGTDYEEAKEMGASDTVAALGATVTSLFNSGIEIGLDGLSGIQGLPQEVAEEGGSKLLKWAISSAEEGGEEALQKFVNEVVTKTMYDHDADILDPKEYATEAAVGAISGMALGGGQIGVQGVANTVQAINAKKLTENEQAVVDKVYQDEIAKKEEQNGRELTNREKKTIYKDILNQLEKGGISIEKIEEVLGGETYKSYQDTIAKEQEVLDELSELYEGDELSQQVEDFLKNSESNQLRKKLGEEVFGLVKGDRLIESYNERGRRRQLFEADVTQYSTKQQEVVQKAIDSGVLNNTNRSHELVNLVAKIYEDKGASFDFTDNQKLLESGFAVEGKQVNGFVHNGNITLNVESANVLQSTVGHEITHVLEGTEVYTELQNILFEYAKGRKATDSKFDSEYKERLYNVRQLYKDLADYQGVKGFENIKKEVVADLVGDYIFSDSAFIHNLSTQHRNVFQKIYDEIKYLCKVATAGSKEARELAKVQKAFEDAYRESGKGAEGTKYSISEIIDEEGNNYGMGVVLDSDLLTDLTDAERKQMVRLRVVEELAGNSFIAYDPDGSAVEIQIANKGETFVNSKGKKRPVLKDLYDKYNGNEIKQEAVVLADELIETSRYGEPQPAHHAHDWLDNYGQNDWDNRTVFIQDKKKTVWEAMLHIANSADGRKILYDIDPIKKAEGSRTWVPTAATDNVAQTEPEVKPQYSLSDSDGRQIRRNLTDILGSDVKLETAPVQETAPVETAPVAESVAPVTEPVIAPVTEEESEAVNRDSFENLTDADAPISEEIVEDVAPVVTPARVEYEAIRPKPVKQPRMVRADRAETKPSEKQRKWVKTSTESDAVDGKVLPEDLSQEKIYYQPIPNKVTLGKANAKLDGMGYETAVAYFNSQFANKSVSLEDVALGERLIQEAIKRGDNKTAGELIQNVSILGTELGQKVQALSIIKRLTPEGQLGVLQKTVERGKTKGDKAFEGVEITQEMIDHILSVYGKDGTYNQDELNKAVEDVKQKIADQMKVTAMDKVNAWRYLSMLGNPKTHIRNLVSNVAMRGTLGVKNAVARTIETIAPIKNRTKTWKPASADVREFAKQTTAEMKDIISGESKYSENASIKEKRSIFKNKILNGVYELNSDLLGKEDWWFSKPAFNNSLSEFLTANGITTKQDIQNNPKIVENAKQYALEQSQIATFRQYSWLANKINEIERKNAATNIAVGAIVPFKKTLINISKAGLNYSPLGFAKTLTYDISQVKKGNMEASELVDHLAQNVTGSALTLVGYLLASAGLLNGAGEDDKEGKYDYQLGEQAYSINIGDATFSLSWLSPVAMPLFVGANAYEQLVEGKEWNGDVVVETLAQTLDPLSEMSFISSLDSVLSSYDSGIQKFAGIGETMAQNYITQFIPTLSSQIATVMDDTKRSTKVAGDSNFKFVDQTINNLIYKIPFLRETLEPSTDIWGNEIKQTEAVMTRAFETFLAPYAKRENIATEVDEEIKGLYGETGDDGLIPSIPHNYVNYDGEKHKMSAKEYTEFKQVYGQTAFDLLEELFDTETYANADSESRADMVNKVYDYAMDEAKREYFAGNGIEFTNATKDGKEYYDIAPIKGAIENDMTPDEYSFSVDYPGKYKFFKDNGISYDTYKNADEDGKRAYTWAYENPEKFTMSKVISDDFMEFYNYKNEMNEFDAKDASGESVSGLKKERVIDYINGLDLDYGQKIILFRSMYDSKEDKNTYNADIVEYLDSRSDISYEEMVEILEALGMKVNGNSVTW